MNQKEQKKTKNNRQNEKETKIKPTKEEEQQERPQSRGNKRENESWSGIEAGSRHEATLSRGQDKTIEEGDKSTRGEKTKENNQDSCIKGD